MISSRLPKPSRVHRSRAFLAGGVVTVLLLGGCGSSDDDSGKDGGETVAQNDVKVYFMAGEQFKPLDHQVDGSGSTPREATEALLDGPEEVDPAAAAKEDIETLIPPGTKVEKLKVDDSGDAEVDLSKDFLDDIPAKAAGRTAAEDDEVTGRLGQVTYTLTSFEKINSVKVRSGGVTVEAPAPRTSGGVSPETEQERADYSKPPAVPRTPKVRGGGGGAEPGTMSLQRKLAGLGYLPSSGVDGVAGYQTEQAVMAFQAWEGLTRDGDAGPQTRSALKTAKRPKPSVKRPNRFMEVHISRGVLLLVKDGRAKRAIHVSGGGSGTETPTGRYRVFRKELMSWSVPFSTWLPYASYFNNGIAFHEYPDVPPYPVSHGCVRVPTPESKRVYDFARMNRVVVVRS
ncbi:MAG: GerMN domain-containing protein [Thermoleophilia bacterium]|nr:GerMN domain-containing protein [Thermoleophilia bacterium]